MGRQGRTLLIAPLEVKCPQAKALFGGAIIGLLSRPQMFYYLNNFFGE